MLVEALSEAPGEAPVDPADTEAQALLPDTDKMLVENTD